MSSLRRGHANLLCIVPIFADDLFRGSGSTLNWALSSAPAPVAMRLWDRRKWAKKNRRGCTGIEPVTSRTQSENHTTRPTALTQKHARRDSNPQPPDSKSDALSIAPRAPQTSVRGAPLGFCPLNGGQKSAQNNRQQRDSNSRGISSK